MTFQKSPKESPKLHNILGETGYDKNRVMGETIHSARMGPGTRGMLLEKNGMGAGNSVAL